MHSQSPLRSRGINADIRSSARRLNIRCFLLGIVAGNIVTLIVAIALKWPASEIMWIYWWQSVFIGVANFYRMWNLTEFTTKGMTMNDRPVPETPEGARSTAMFFAVHYGIFHLVYMGFLTSMTAELDLPEPVLIDRIMAVIAILSFFASHLFSLHYNATRDFRSKKPNLGSLMFYPYLRIIPMHMTIILGGALGAFSLILFIGLKTAADAGMHAIEHQIFRADSK